MIDKANAAAAAERAERVTVRAVMDEVARETAADPLSAGRTLAAADEIISLACAQVRDNQPDKMLGLEVSMALAQAKAQIGIGQALLVIGRALERLADAAEAS